MLRVITRRAVVLLAALLLLAAAAACGRRDAEPAPTPAPAEEVVPAAPETSIEPQAPAQDVRPVWPQGWKELDRGQAGPAAAPLVWYRVDAGAEGPEAAARAALGALRAHAGTIVLEDVAASRTEPVAVAHLRGSRLTGVAEARTRDGRTEVRVTLEPAP